MKPPVVIAVLAALTAGCAGNYRLEETRTEGVATSPADVLQLQWRKKMTTRKFLEFRP